MWSEGASDLFGHEEDEHASELEVLEGEREPDEPLLTKQEVDESIEAAGLEAD